MPLKVSLKLFHGGHSRSCEYGSCNHTNPLLCVATKYDVPVEWLYDSEKCECPCHPTIETEVYQDKVISYEFEL